MPPFPAYHRPLSLPYSRQQDLPALLLRADPSSSVESSPSTTGDSISASDLILEAEEHWNVSAKSIPFLGHHSSPLLVSTTSMEAHLPSTTQDSQTFAHTKRKD